MPIRFENWPTERCQVPGSRTSPAWSDYDSYYYDRNRELPLPVWRVSYGDPQRTSLYVDPARGVILRKEERLTRLNRWLYHGLHSLDFPFLYYRRPLWDVVVITLSIGGLLLTLTTVCLRGDASGGTRGTYAALLRRHSAFYIGRSVGYLELVSRLT
jgi:hypothetical protein